ncbi:phospholipase A1 PLIP2, chloroplastic-like isoform X2 [Primulina eburnea]|uniref:phospholipase A1 PLIP2, chloroplastic-like isoform X2 n=1 Tax=Primulina eburnea TaxID=1245227 RepID=UPI003C6BFD1A
MVKKFQMDAWCMKAGIQALAAAPMATTSNGGFLLSAADKPSVSAATRGNMRWGFNFGHPLRSLLPGGRNQCEPAIAVDDAVLVEEKEEIEESEEDALGENWVFKLSRSESLESDGVRLKVGGDGNCGEENEECDARAIDDDEKFEFNRESFSKLLRKVPLKEARLYARMSYLGTLAYSIPQIKPENLLKNHGLRFLTSSIEKKEQASKSKKEKLSVEAEAQDEERNEIKQKGGEPDRPSASAAYQIAASTASYLHSHSKSMASEILSRKIDGNAVNVDMINKDMTSLIGTTDSVTAVVAAKEEVKQAVADDLNSTRSSPCEWFVCDDDRSATRLFVIQGSESMASWQANLLFEPIQFEGLDVLVHRGIYEAAKGMYDQMLPEIRDHLKAHGDRATLRFTGHSLGGSLSLLINLMLLIRGEASHSSLVPVITFGAPSIMCGGDRLLRTLKFPQNHIRSVIMHRDIVPRAFSCNYPNYVAQFLKAVNGKFRNHPCLDKQKLLYAPMGEFLILQPDNKFSPNHDLLPSGSGLYVLSSLASDFSKAEKRIRAAQAVFLNAPHPLDTLSDRSAYGSLGTIQRDHDMSSYLTAVRHVIRKDLNRIRKAKREHHRKVWLPLYSPGVDGGIIVSRPVTTVGLIGQVRCKLSVVTETSTETLKRFGALVRSKHMHLLVVLLFPARLLIGDL